MLRILRRTRPSRKGGMKNDLVGVVGGVYRVTTVIFNFKALMVFFLPFTSVAANSAGISPVTTRLTLNADIRITNITGRVTVSTVVLFPFLLATFSTILGVFKFGRGNVHCAISNMDLFGTICLLIVVLSGTGGCVSVHPLASIAGITCAVRTILLIITTFIFTTFTVTCLFVSSCLRTGTANKGAVLEGIVRFFHSCGDRVGGVI